MEREARTATNAQLIEAERDVFFARTELQAASTEMDEKLQAAKENEEELLAALTKAEELAKERKESMGQVSLDAQQQLEEAAKEGGCGEGDVGECGGDGC